MNPGLVLQEINYVEFDVHVFRSDDILSFQLFIQSGAHEADQRSPRFLNFT